MTVLSRALLTLEGTLRTIDPSFNLAHEATALLPALAEPDSDGCVQQQLEKELVRALPSLRTLPGHAEAIAAQLRGGRLSMRVERFAGADREVVDGWVDRVIVRRRSASFGLLSSAVLLLAAAVVDGIRTSRHPAAVRLLRARDHLGDPDAHRRAAVAPRSRPCAGSPALTRPTAPHGTCLTFVHQV